MREAHEKASDRSVAKETTHSTGPDTGEGEEFSPSSSPRGGAIVQMGSFADLLEQGARVDSCGVSLLTGAIALFKSLV